MADTGKGYAGFFAGKKDCGWQKCRWKKKFLLTASEKIAEEMYQFEGPGLAVALGQYLMERCEEKTLGEQILLPHKSLEKAINFIPQRVYEESKDYLQQNRNGQNGAGVAVSSQKVVPLGWKNTMR